MRLLDELEKRSPLPELLIRKAYYDVVKPLNIKVSHKKHKETNREAEKCDPCVSSAMLRDALISMGISKGDLLIVHSSASGLEGYSGNMNELLDVLLSIVGEEGTLAMPAFPEESRMKEKDGIKIYDPIRSVAWTGMMPNLLIRKKGAIRSECPYNPLVAIGKQAEDMMRGSSSNAYAHGEGSCWKYCVDHHAKILYLGLPAFHSFTILHVIEDSYINRLLPKTWYSKRQYYVKQGSELNEREVYVKGVEWSKYLAERNTEQKYIRNKMMKATRIENIEIRLIEDASTLLTTILGDWEKYKFLYLPRRYRWEKGAENESSN